MRPICPPVRRAAPDRAHERRGRVSARSGRDVGASAGSGGAERTQPRGVEPQVEPQRYVMKGQRNREGSHALSGA